MDKFESMNNEELFNSAPEIFEKALLDCLESKYDKRFIINNYIILTKDDDVKVQLSTEDDRIRFTVSITTDFVITDDYQRACCYSQIEEYISMLIPDAYVSVSFIEDFRPESKMFVSYDEYISDHDVSAVMVRVFTCENSPNDELLQTVYNVLFKMCETEVEFFCYDYNENDYPSAIEELKKCMRITNTIVQKTNPKSFHPICFTFERS